MSSPGTKAAREEQKEQMPKIEEYDTSFLTSYFSPQMGSEASADSFVSQSPMDYDTSRGYVLGGVKMERSASHNSRLQATAGAFRPRPTSNIPDGPEAISALIPESSTPGDFSTGQFRHAAEALREEFPQPFHPQVPRRNQFAPEHPMFPNPPAGFPPVRQMAPHNAAIPHYAPQYFVQQPMRMNHNQLPPFKNPSLPPISENFAGNPLSNYHDKDSNISHHPMVPIGKTPSPKHHGASPNTNRHKMINRQRGPHELNLDFQFPLPSGQMGEPIGSFDADTSANYQSVVSQPSQLIAPSVTADGAIPPKQGHIRYETAIRIPEHSHHRDASEDTLRTVGPESISDDRNRTPIRFVDGVPFGPTPSPSFDRDLSQSVNQPNRMMTGDSTPTHIRRQTVDFHTKYGAPPKFVLSATKQEDHGLAVPAVVNQPFASQVPSSSPLVSVDSIDINSATFKKLLATFRGGNPTFDSAMHFLPLGNQLEASTIPAYGVLRIRNIPFGVKRSEILAFLGRGARLVPESEGEPIHIIMDRLSGKTMDAYVEYISLDEAIKAASRYVVNRNGGRGGRLCDRFVEVDVVDPARLMQDIFPKTKHVEWQGYSPVITLPDPNKPNDTPFKEFTTAEELNMLFKHIEQPSRSPFSKHCPQRSYECLISVMLKYPWFMTSHIRVKDRNYLWKVVLDSVVILKETIENGKKDNGYCLTRQLQQRLCRAVRQCKGFTMAQKFEIHRVAEVHTHWDIPMPEQWIWQALGPVKTLTDESDVLEYYMALINALSTKKLTRDEQRRLSTDRKKDAHEQIHNHTCWGPVRINYPPDYETLTMAQIASLEFQAIEDCLRSLDEPANVV